MIDTEQEVLAWVSRNLPRWPTVSDSQPDTQPQGWYWRWDYAAGWALISNNGKCVWGPDAPSGDESWGI